MVTGIFGGSFNPVHNGHIRLVKSAMERFFFDRMIIIPSNIAPHKDSSDFASDKDRLEMCRLAFSDIHGTELCDYEIEVGGVSYTINTLRYLKDKYPEDEFSFILGSDMLLTFDEWKDYKEILSMTTIVCASRENGENEALIRKKAELTALGGKIELLNIEPYVLSSSDIRSLVATKQDLSCYLPERVVKYIRDNNLYLEQV